MSWRPIDTARDTVESVLLWNGKKVFLGWRDDDGWHDAESPEHSDRPVVPQPTHWMPKPAPPLGLAEFQLEHMSRWDRNDRLYCTLKSMGVFVSPIVGRDGIDSMIVSADLPQIDPCRNAEVVTLNKPKP